MCLLTMAEHVAVHEIPVSQKSRYERIRKLYFENYGKRPTFYARASGRVNLIGEHIDYCGYAVLPMAIEQDIVIAAAPSDSGQITLRNTSENFKSYSCSVTDVDIDKSNPKWHHYFLCGYKGMLEHLGLDTSVGLDLLLDGTVPQSAGLSSSSALVCCSALAVMYANDRQCTKLELAEVCQRCERYIGTEGGGMDQSIAFLAEAGNAKLIEFNPIRTTSVQMPDEAVFVISNCCVGLNKAATSHFNTRVAECRLATQLLAKAKSLKWKDFRRLGDLQNHLALSLDDMMDLVKVTLHPEPYSKQKVCDLLGVTADEINDNSLSERTFHLDSFKLYERAHHVYSEANRVIKFKAICDTQENGALDKLGQLMNESHASCRDQYECSCTELDQLTEIARECGALGSRLTGAGWGGCVVSLVARDHVTSFQEQVKARFYDGDVMRSSKVKDSLFATQPGGGAAIYTD